MVESKTDHLFDDLADNHNDMVWKLHLLIESDWDSPTLKEKLRQLVKDNQTIWNEIESEDKCQCGECKK